MTYAKSRCALLTYHSAYNYGSVLQAYATQQALMRIGVNVEIINYRMMEQKYFYEKLVRPKYGINSFINDLTLLPVHSQKCKRNNAFESFFEKRLTMTRECTEPEDVYALWEDYDTIVSGSDQIWNKNSCEMEKNDWRYMDPYLLKGYSGKKVSFASSINTMTGNYLQHIIPYLEQFDSLSFREKESSKAIRRLLNKEVECVLDPTFLLTNQEWIEKLKLRKYEDREPYVLCYSLAGVRPILRMLYNANKIANRYNYKVIVVTPFAFVPYPSFRIENHLEYGPREFLEALYNAEAVITDSYHGMVLSINFGKQFYLTGRRLNTDIRKTDILNQLGLTEQAMTDAEALTDHKRREIDYSAANEKLELLRRSSLSYLMDNLNKD